jgi:hypothetical protein
MAHKSPAHRCLHQEFCFRQCTKGRLAKCAPLWHTHCPTDSCNDSFSQAEMFAVGSPTRSEFQFRCAASWSAYLHSQNLSGHDVHSPDCARGLRFCRYSPRTTAAQRHCYDSTCERQSFPGADASIPSHRRRQHEHKRHLASKRRSGRKRIRWDNFFVRLLHCPGNSAARRERNRHSRKPGQSKRQRFSHRDSPRQYRRHCSPTVRNRFNGSSPGVHRHRYRNRQPINRRHMER